MSPLFSLQRRKKHEDMIKPSFRNKKNKGLREIKSYQKPQDSFWTGDNSGRKTDGENKSKVIAWIKAINFLWSNKSHLFFIHSLAFAC